MSKHFISHCGCLADPVLTVDALDSAGDILVEDAMEDAERGHCVVCGVWCVCVMCVWWGGGGVAVVVVRSGQQE